MREPFTRDQLLKLMRELVDQQYGGFDEEEEPKSLPEVERILGNVGAVDLTQTPPNDLMKELRGCGHFYVGSYVLQITRATEKVANVQLSVIRNKLYNKLQVSKDPLFGEAPWIVHFRGRVDDGKDLSWETVVEIVRWFQLATRMPMFL